jgi:hypothetical protein
MAARATHEVVFRFAPGTLLPLTVARLGDPRP